MRLDVVVLEYLDYMKLVSTWVVMFPELLHVFWVHESRKQSRLPYIDLLEILETRAMSSHGGEAEVPATQPSPHQSVHQSDHESLQLRMPRASQRHMPRSSFGHNPRARL